MAATVTIRVYTGTDATTESTAQTGIDLISANNATNTSTNRATYPITAGTNSYEKWIKARVDAAPDNYVNTFKLYGDGTVQQSTVLYVGATTTGATATTATSSIATNAWTDYTNTTNGFDWHSTNMTAEASTTRYAVFQLAVAADAAAGNWTQETLSYSYNEA
jgi:hypothetical protein